MVLQTAQRRLDEMDHNYFDAKIRLDKYLTIEVSRSNPIEPFLRRILKK